MMQKLALAILLLASTAEAQTALLYTDSKLFAGYPAATTSAYVTSWRNDYAWTSALLPGRDSADSADLASLLAANNYDLVVIDLAVNDPVNTGDYSADGTIVRLESLCGMAEADGAVCVLLTPMHAPTFRGTTLDHEQFTEAVAERLRSGGRYVVDVRAAMPLSEWQTACMDASGLHPNTDACRQKLARYIAPRLP